MDQPLNILIVATKAPWPPVDGGRVVILETIDALAASGHAVTLVAPVDPETGVGEIAAVLQGRCRVELVPAKPRGARSLLAASLLRRRPVTVVRHQLPEVRRRVTKLVAEQRYDVVQAEQLQAIAQTEPAVRRGVPLVYRAHNVESALWTYAGQFGRPLTARLLRREASRLSLWEERAVSSAAATVVLTELDREPLREVAGDDNLIEKVPVPYPSDLPAHETALPGRPAVVTLASASWLPSRETARTVADSWWPVVRQRLPEAVLHVFGGVAGERGEEEGVRWHPPPEHSIEAFANGAVVAVPTRHPTGVPVKALEAWARGLPLVASTETAAALEAEDGAELAVADGPEAFAETLERLQADAEYRAGLVKGGRALLRGRHDPATVAETLAELYRRLTS
jgi:glycosyltransferase involved in cell wall biosynthesis